MASDDFRDELDAIKAIYPECLTKVGEQMVDIVIPQHEEYKVRMSFPDTYPATEMPHILQVHSSNRFDDDQYLESLFNEVLESVYTEGNVCIFDFLTELDGVLFVENDDDDDVMANTEVYEEIPESEEIDIMEGWTCSDPITDRGSTFIGFVRRVYSEEEMEEKLSLLKRHRKIRRANHNMTAWRIQNQDGTRVQDRDDDGETAAGGRLLHLLTMMDVWNVIVVVSRWFGGVHIGPDRFRHINSAAREAIVRAGFVDESKKSKRKKK